MSATEAAPVVAAKVEASNKYVRRLLAAGEFARQSGAQDQAQPQ